jgi:hypothetical protein
MATVNSPLGGVMESKELLALVEKQGETDSCPYCKGTGVVEGVVDDIAFEFPCVCQGGEEEAIRWLLGIPPPLGDDYRI